MAATGNQVARYITVRAVHSTSRRAGKRRPVVRYRHYLTPEAPGSNPRCLILVDAHGILSEIAGGQRDMLEALESWTALVLHRDGDTYRVGATVSSNKADKWWAFIRENMAGTSTLWVVCYRAARIWSLLGLWEELESERVSIPAAPIRGSTEYHDAVRRLREASSDPLGPISAAGLSRVLDRAKGWFIHSTSTAILRARVAGQPGWLLWLDSSNWGVEPPMDCHPGVGVCSWVANWIQTWCKYSVKYKLGGLRATAGAQAMHAWRSGYYAPGVYCHVEPRAGDLERSAYCGGRCECYRIGGPFTGLWHVDYRSQYASVCMDTCLPVRLEGYDPMPDRAAAIRDHHRSGVIARVRIRTDEPAYPLRREWGVIYPIGRFTTTLCGPELEDALRHDRVESFLAIASYHMEPALHDFALAMYTMRVECDGVHDRAMSEYAKTLYCTLPGKLAQRSIDWQPTRLSCNGVGYGEWIGRNEHGEQCRYRAIAGKVYQETIGSLADDANLAMAAWITSVGRVRLLRAIRIAHWEEVYYDDTDGLICSTVGGERLKCSPLWGPGQPGGLSCKDQPTETEIRGIKHYRADRRIVCAGMPAYLPSGGNCHQSPGVYDSPTEAIRLGRRPQAIVIGVDYRRIQPYRHGIVGQDGRVSPFRLEE